MPRQSTITIAGPEQLTDRNWRRFLAGLCLLEFYVNFVRYGTELARGVVWLQEYREEMFWIHVARVPRALVFLGLGRALWRGRGSVPGWGIAGFVSTFALLGTYSYSGKGTWGIAALIDLIDGWVLWEFLPLLAGLATGAWCWMRERQAKHATRGWAAVAAVWCFAQAPLVFFPYGIAEPYADGLSFLGKGAGFLACAMGYSLALCCTGTALLLQNKAARLLSYALGCAISIPIVMNAYTLPMLTNVAIEALMISNPAHPQNPVPWPWLLLNHWSFIDVFVVLPWVLVPWLLIAWYVRHVPMRGMPDDGTPYPRVYCGKCRYNLRGLMGGNCPECGAAVAAARCDLDSECRILTPPP